jgi:hypothetical protein
MLARYLRQYRPVRYQLSRELLPHAANYLSLAYRGHNLPLLAQQAQEQGHLQHPAIAPMLNAIAHGRDPYALDEVLDVIHDTEPHRVGTHGVTPVAQFLKGLHGLYHMLYGQGLPAEQLEHRFGYDPNHGHPALFTGTPQMTRTALGEHWFGRHGFFGPQSQATAQLRSVNPEAADAAGAARFNAQIAKPQGYADYYDVLHRLSGHAQLPLPILQALSAARDNMAGGINHLILPLLLGGGIRQPT